MRALYVVLQAIIGLAIIAVAWIAASVVIKTPTSCRPWERS